MPEKFRPRMRSEDDSMDAGAVGCPLFCSDDPHRNQGTQAPDGTNQPVVDQFLQVSRFVDVGLCEISGCTSAIRRYCLPLVHIPLAHYLIFNMDHLFIYCIVIDVLVVGFHL